MQKNLLTRESETGIRELDGQHRQIERSLLKVSRAAAQSADKNLIIPLLDKTRNLILEHFKLEEKYMDDSDYPDTDGHKVLHGEFMEEFEDIYYKARTGMTGPEFARELRENVAGWFVMHIEKNDSKLAFYINGKWLFAGYAPTDAPAFADCMSQYTHTARIAQYNTIATGDNMTFSPEDPPEDEEPESSSQVVEQFNFP
jgi:hemerythrin